MDLNQIKNKLDNLSKNLIVIDLQLKEQVKELDKKGEVNQGILDLCLRIQK